MRLSKKKVAVMIAAVMLACSLAACGGSGSASNPGTAGGASSGTTNNPSASTGSNTTDDSNKKPDSGPKDDNVPGGPGTTEPEEPDAAKKTTWKASRTGQYFSTGKMYYKCKGTFYGQPAVMESAGDAKSGDIYTSFTVDGVKVYAELTRWEDDKVYTIYYPGIEDVPGVAALPEYLKGKTFYTEEATDENTDKAQLPGDNTEVEIGEYEYPQNSSNRYYAEKLQNSNLMRSVIYCYDSVSGKLKLRVYVDEKTGKEVPEYYDEVANDFPDALMELPEGAIKLDQDAETGSEES